jgi:hypothetical protein
MGRAYFYESTRFWAGLPKTDGESEDKGKDFFYVSTKKKIRFFDPSGKS